MKIGLIFPNKDRRYKTIHLGLGYLAAYAREHHEGLEFQLLDTRVANSRETKKFFSTKFDLIGITVFSPVYYEVIGIMNRIRKINPDTPICIGGPYVTTIREEIFKETPAEYAVYGEGEITFSELISHMKGEKEIREIKGLIYRDENGNTIINPEREKIKNLDTIPRPAYDIFPMDRYPLHRMVSSRGCPFACSWCNSSSIWDHNYRASSIEKVVDDIEYLICNYGKKIFVFGDNTFNSSVKRVDAFCDLLLERKIDILWAVSLRADIMTRELAHKMKKAGCYNVSIGIESANNEILKKLGKRATIEEMTAGIKMVQEAGIEIMSQFVIGSPYETLEHVKESIAYAKTSGCDYTNFYSVLPFKRSPQWEYVSEHGKFLVDNIHDFHELKPKVVFETPEFPYEDRVKAIAMVKKEGFYSNQDKKNWMFDFAKETSRKIQRLLPKSAGERLYMILKSIYRLKLVKKHNQ
jgi:anaerobic magnesium-protoporphyrin IX monomethyl ester cyclase